VSSAEHHQVAYDTSLAGLAVVGGPCQGRLVGDSVQVAGGTATDRQLFLAAAAAAGLPTGPATTVRFLTGSSGGSGDVVVSLDVPYGLGSSPASAARIALYGRTPDAFRALVDVLVGAARGGGHLPVPVDGVERSGC
jgi:beta-N-acetylhexosaminidase